MSENVSRGPAIQLDLDAYSPPYNRNCSSWAQRTPICILAGVGFLAATYLSLYQWGLIDSAWDPFFGDGTERVLDSQQSEQMRRWMRIPDGWLGAIAYLGDAIYGLAGSTRRWQYRPWMTILFGLDVVPLGLVSAFLVFVQGAFVGYWCSICIFTAIISLLLVYFAYDEVWGCLLYLWRVWKTGDRKLFWHVLWGGASLRAHEIAEELIREKTNYVAARR